ncbi:Hint domain-containing protein [Roseicyclus elongatus]|nr:Hint domain-containing protein [Roseibacterium elongatum]
MLAWAQTWIEGLPAEPNQELAEGMTWRWHGRALPLEGDGAALMLSASRDHEELRARAARVVRKLLQHPARSPADLSDDPEDPLLSGGFIVSDGAGFFTAVPVPVEDGATPILMFPDGLPAPGRDHTIIARSERFVPQDRQAAASVICFTPGTRLRTEQGEAAIEDLGPGDRILTRDDGPQEVIWSGNRRMSGARLFAMPDQRPIRLRAGALGVDRPDADLVVSPEHRILVGGAASRDLWGEPEVLVRAADLVGDTRVTVDHSLRETYYIHLMLDRHQVVWANGLEVETFHPGFMGLDHLSRLQRDCLLDMRPELEADPHAYGAPARRALTQAEAAILLEGARMRPGAVRTAA